MQLLVLISVTFIGKNKGYLLLPMLIDGPPYSRFCIRFDVLENVFLLTNLPNSAQMFSCQQQSLEMLTAAG